MDEVEPTQAADVPDDGTQSIHAWSQADDATEVATYALRRSWKLPIAVAVLAAAAITAGAVTVWPHATSTHPTPAPTAAPTTTPPAPAPKPQTPDERFLALLQQRGQIVVSPPLAINTAHWVCTAQSQGYTAPQITQNLVEGTPGGDLRSEAVFVDTAKEVFCP